FRTLPSFRVRVLHSLSILSVFGYPPSTYSWKFGSRVSQSRFTSITAISPSSSITQMSPLQDLSGSPLILPPLFGVRIPFIEADPRILGLIQSPAVNSSSCRTFRTPSRERRYLPT